MSEIKNILQEEVAEGGMTGADFNYVLGSAQGAESHFRWLELPSSKLILSHLATAFTNHVFWVSVRDHISHLQVKS